MLAGSIPATCLYAGVICQWQLVPAWAILILLLPLFGLGIHCFVFKGVPHKGLLEKPAMPLGLFGTQTRNRKKAGPFPMAVLTCISVMLYVQPSAVIPYTGQPSPPLALVRLSALKVAGCRRWVQAPDVAPVAPAVQLRALRGGLLAGGPDAAADAGRPSPLGRGTRPHRSLPHRPVPARQASLSTSACLLAADLEGPELP